MCGKKLLSIVLAICMVASLFAGLTFTSGLSVAADSSVSVSTPAVWIGPSTHSTKVPSAIFYPLCHPKDYSDGTTAVLSATVKKLAGASGSKPYVTMYRSKKAGGNSNQIGIYTYPGWANNAGSTYNESTGAFSCTVTFGDIPGNSNSWYYSYFKSDGSVDRVFAWSGVNGIWGGISIGNCAYDDEGHSADYTDFTAEYIITNVSLVITGRSESLVNDVSSYDDASVYSLTGPGPKGSNSSAHNIPFEGSRTTWKSFTTDSTTIKFGEVASDFMSVGTSGYTSHAENDYNVQYYTRSACSGVNFKKYGSGCFMKMGSPTKKSFVIKSGGSSTYTNLYIPVNVHDWFSGFDRTDATCSDQNAAGDLRDTGGTFRLRITFKCRVISGSGVPVVGRMYSYKANEDSDGTKHDNELGWPTPSSWSAYNTTGSDSSSYNTDVIAVTPNITNGVYTADLSMESGNYQQMSRSGVTDFITIGLAEHSANNTTDFGGYNSSATFVISDIKFQVYGIYNQSLSNQLLFGGANQAPEMIEDNYDITTPHLYTARGTATVDEVNIAMNTRDSKLNHYYAEGEMANITDIKANICNINNCTLTHHDATENAREYYECTTHNKKYDDIYATNELSSVVILHRMLRLGGYGSNQQALRFETELTRGTTYQYDIDYRACGGVSAIYAPQVSNTTSGYEDITYYSTISLSDSGTHYSVRFTMPNTAKINTNNFKFYLGQKWPLRRNGVVYFANATLRVVQNGSPTGGNLISNGTFQNGSVGQVTAGTKDTVFGGWEQMSVMTYPSVYLLDIPNGFFTENSSLNLEKAYEFKGGDVYKPQFDFHFTAGTTYKLIYDYYCADNDTVNAYIISKDNSVTAVKNSKTGNGRFEATYTITAAAGTNAYTSQQAANGNIRFALNNNSYKNSFYVSNIRMYRVSGGNITGANLVMNLNPALSDSIYSVSSIGDKTSFTLAKNDSNCDSVKSNIANGWVGNLDYNSYSIESTYAKVVKTNGHLFDYYSPAESLTAMVNALLNREEDYNPYKDSSSRFYDPLSDGVLDIRDLVKLKKDYCDNVNRFAVASEQTNGGIYSSFTNISCYGDSITQGMGYSESSPQKTYPGRLSSMLGGGYTVYNCGDPGEATPTIMARQGALTMKTNKAFTFPAGTAQIQIGTKSDNGFTTSTNKLIDLTNALGNQRSINNVIIGDSTYELIMTDFVWSPRSCNIHLKRTNTSSSLTIPAGTEVKFNCNTRQTDCDIYLMGANGHYTSANDLVAQFKALVDNHGSNNFLIVIPFWNDYCDTPFREAFGDHCVSLREVAISTGLSYEGITPTSTDNEYIARGEVPPSLLYYPDNPDVHLNAKGYDLLAHILYEKGDEIGLW